MRLATRGIHHLALNTDDMRTTVDFYTKVVGMPLVHAKKRSTARAELETIEPRWAKTTIASGGFS